eukprot:3646821-Pyramimonas_sp.AAC.1
MVTGPPKPPSLFDCACLFLSPPVSSHGHRFWMGWSGCFWSQPQARAPAASQIRAGRARAELPNADGLATSAARRRAGRREGGVSRRIKGMGIGMGRWIEQIIIT